MARRSPVDLNGSYRGPASSADSVSLWWGSVQQQLHGPELRVRGHQGAAPIGWEPLGAAPPHAPLEAAHPGPPKGDAGLRHYPHGSGRALLSAGLEPCALCRQRLPALCPHEASACHPGLARHVFLMKTCASPAAGRPGRLPSHPALTAGSRPASGQVSPGLRVFPGF